MDEKEAAAEEGQEEEGENKRVSFSARGSAGAGKEPARGSKDARKSSIKAAPPTMKAGRKTGATAMRGIFALSGKDLDAKIRERMVKHGVDPAAIPDADIVYDLMPKEMFNEFVDLLDNELRHVEPQTLLERFEKMREDEFKLIQLQLQSQGVELPTEGGAVKISKSFIEKLPRDTLIGTLTRITKIANEGLEATDGTAQPIQKFPDKYPDEEDQYEFKSRGSQSQRASTDKSLVELILTDDQKDEFYEKLMDEGVQFTVDESTGRPKFTKLFLRSIPQAIANEILLAARANNDPNAYSMDTRSSFAAESTTTTDEESPQGQTEETRPKNKELEGILGLHYSPNSGITYIVDNDGVRLPFEKVVDYLMTRFSDTDLKRHEDLFIDREASVKAAIREARRQEDKNSKMKKTPSELEIQKMAMRFIPQHNPNPRKSDPISLFAKEIRLSIPEAAPLPEVKLELTEEPTIQRVDSLETIQSTMDQRLSNISVVGSTKSTMLSDLPSEFSQNLPEDASTVFTATNTQIFDITPESVTNYRLKWLKAFMTGHTPMPTFIISIINMVTRKHVDMRVTKENTLNEICHMYMQYEDHPERYVWKDLHGRMLVPDKTVAQNGLVMQEEVLEFQGYRRTPTILLYFRDGFENDPLLPLNPLHALRQREPTLCRNY